MNAVEQAIGASHPMTRRQFRFNSLLGGVVVAYPIERDCAVVVRMDVESWECYTHAVEFTAFSSD
jgi:hypothetical protein